MDNIMCADTQVYLVLFFTYRCDNAQFLTYRSDNDNAQFLTCRSDNAQFPNYRSDHDNA